MDRLERDVQAALEEFNRMEPGLEAICRRAGTLREAATLMAAELGVDRDALAADFERHPRSVAAGLGRTGPDQREERASWSPV
jgi:hypothetical protein